MRLFKEIKPNKLSLVISFVLCFTITSLAQIVVGPGSGSGGSGGGAVWGAITGTLSDQTDLQTALDAKVTLNGAGGTPTSLTLTNATGLPVATGISGLGSGVATWLATPSSANLASAVTGETGSGALVFGTTPTFTTSFLLESAGVSFAAADGVLTLLGLGNGNDENLTIDFDNASADMVNISSTTALTILRVTFPSANVNTGIDIYNANTGAVDGAFLRISRGNDVTKGLSLSSGNDTAGQGAGIASTLLNAGLNLTVANNFPINFSTNNTPRISLEGDGDFLPFGATDLGGSSNFFAELYATDIFLASAGIKFSAADGVLTILGAGNGNDENLTWDFDNAAANEVNVGTGTGVTTIDFGTIILEGAFASSDGSAGVTVTTCTSFKDGLCVAGT